MDGGTTLLISVVHSHLPWPSWLFYQPYQAVESTMDRMHNTHSVQFLDSFFYFSMLPLPGKLHCLTVSTHRLTGSQLAFPFRTSSITLTWKWKSPMEVCRFWPCRISVISILSSIGKIKTSSSCGGECLICNVKGNFLTLIICPL